MARLLIFIKKNFFVILLAFLEIILFLANYKRGTYLVGWDGLYPEFNFSENVRRNIFGVWQQYRGLGLLDGMSYAANLVHTIFVWFLSLFLPKNLLRYIFIFLMHFLGGLGVYLLMNELLVENKKSASFLSTLFYLFNLATVQMFFTPFEVFSVHFAFLPFLLLTAIRFFKNGTKKALSWIMFVSILTISQGHVPTVFIVYFLALLTLIFFQILNNGRKFFERILVILSITFLINTFWGLPYFWSALKNSKIISESKVNQMATEDIWLKTKAFGDFTNTILLKSSSLNFTEIQPSRQNGYIMEAWRKHLRSPLFSLSGYLFFLLAVFGLVKVVYKKERSFFPFVCLFVFSFMMLGQDVPILNLLPQFLNKYVPFFFQIFRFSFTKFSIIFVFCYSLLVGAGLAEILSKIGKRKSFIFLIMGMYILFLAYYSLPSFMGNFLYDNLRLKIPDEYFEMMSYFKTQSKNSRIVTLPQPSFWGWTYTDWNYRGSGFQWFGIPQPTLDGAFLPWSSQNENYYHEISYAVYSQNLLFLEKVLEKYQISWLLLDGNIVSYTSPKSLYFDQLEKLINSSEKIKFSASFGKIKIYQVLLETKPKDFVFLTPDLLNVGPIYQWNNLDQAFVDYGSYTSEVFPSPSANSFTSEVKDSGAYYPFRSLFTGREQEELEFKVEDNRDSFIFKAKIPKELVNGKLIIPEISEPEILEIAEDDLTKIKPLQPKVYLDGELVDYSFNFTSEESSPSARPPSEVSLSLSYIKEGNLEVKVPKVQGIFSYDSDKDSGFFNKESQTCDAFNNGKYSLEKITENEKKFFRFTALNSSSCLDLNLPNLGNRYSYLVTVESRNIKGKSLLFWLENLQSRKADIETYLPTGTSFTSEVRRRRNTTSEVFSTSYFVQPPMDRYGLGYSLHFNNISIGNDETINDLVRVSVNPIPYKFLTEIKIVKNQPSVVSSQSSDINAVHLEGGGDLQVSHPNESFYKVEIPNTQPASLQGGSLAPSTYLVLSQSFSKDWLAFEKTGKFSFNKLKDHVLVNNWENGWKLESSVVSNQSSDCLKAEDCKLATIYIFFWPQILEYLGFLLLLATPLVIWKLDFKE